MKYIQGYVSKSTKASKVKETLGRGWNPSVYGNIQQTFYAMLIDSNPSNLKWPSSLEWPSNPDIWSKELRQEKVIGPKEYSYFIIKTAVGVGAKGKNDIKRVHIRFRLIPMRKTISDPEVISIYPHSMSQLAGQRKVIKRIEKRLGIGGLVRSKQKFVVVDANLAGGGKYDKSSNESIDYTLPYNVVIANASGTGNRAMWEFYQEEGMAAIGQFDLKIYFRIPKKDIPRPWPQNGVIRDLYCIDWNVEINRKRLVDHTIDFKGGNWNMKVNGRHLMDRSGNIEYEEKPKAWKHALRTPVWWRYQLSEPKYKQYWNVNFVNLCDDELKKHKDSIYKMMIEEEHKAEKQRLLRPLYLVDNNPQ